MADISFWGGVGVIGSSKILIEQEGWRVLLDFGLDFSPGAGLFRQGVKLRSAYALYDRLKTGQVPLIPHIYRADAMHGFPLAAGTDHRTALFITHGHIDHIGLTGWVDPAIPIYCSPQTCQLMNALAAAGDVPEGHMPSLVPMEQNVGLTWGPFVITRYPVDHDVVGASGYAVETEDGVVAFTGDIRLHGRYPERSRNFAQAVHGARALVIEGTTLSFGFGEAPRTEGEVDQLFVKAIHETPGLVLLTLYPRNLERVQAFLELARKEGRTMVWPCAMATFFRSWGFDGIVSFPDDVDSDSINRDPSKFILQVNPEFLPWLLELPVGPGSVFLHANGEPLGTFDPQWDVLQDWLKFLHVPFWPIGTGGHAVPDDLNRLVEWIEPDILFPLHSQEPDRLIPPPGTVRWLPQRGGRRYPLGGRT
ncbi:MAG: MBL fold metallo-hydrolase [Sulfobacillus sp.]